MSLIGVWLENLFQRIMKYIFKKILLDKHFHSNFFVYFSTIFIRWRSIFSSHRTHRRLGCQKQLTTKKSLKYYSNLKPIYLSNFNFCEIFGILLLSDGNLKWIEIIFDNLTFKKKLVCPPWLLNVSLLFIWLA